MRLLGAARTIGRVFVLWGGLWVDCPPLYAHKNKFQDFIMPMYLSLSMCVQWTVLSGGSVGGSCNCNCCCCCCCFCICCCFCLGFTTGAQWGRILHLFVCCALCRAVFNFLLMFNWITCDWFIEFYWFCNRWNVHDFYMRIIAAVVKNFNWVIVVYFG